MLVQSQLSAQGEAVMGDHDDEVAWAPMSPEDCISRYCTASHLPTVGKTLQFQRVLCVPHSFEYSVSLHPEKYFSVLTAQ